MEDVEKRLLDPKKVASEHLDLSDFASDASALFDWLRPQVTQAMLESIAEADYGYMAKENLELLVAIVETGHVQHPMHSMLREVLHLTRWAEGDSVDHIERAFACSLLCIEFTDCHDGCPIDDGTSTLPILIESCIHLGRPAMERLLGLFVAIVEGHPDHESGVHDFMIAQYSLLLVAAWLSPDDPRLPAYIEHMVDSYRTGWERDPEPGWLADILFGGLRDDLLRSLTSDILGESPKFASIVSAMQEK